MEDTFLISTPFKSVEVHPVVPFLILEQYIRRSANQDHIIGTIMGSVSNGILKITNCFVVNYTFSEDGLNDDGKQFNDTLSQLYSTSNKSEVVLGWFSTVSSPVVADKKWFILNNYYRTICQLFKPIFLAVNVALEGDRINEEVYSVTSVILNNTVLAIKFTSLPLQLTASTPENQVIQSLVGYENCLLETTTGESYNDLVKLKQMMENAYAILEESEEYIKKVMNGEIESTTEISRKMFNAIASVPIVNKEVFKMLFNSKLQDFSLVSYLSSLASQQIQVAEEVNRVFKGH